MTYLMSAILGFVQGVAEFLPISSSGHLTLLQHFFELEQVDTLYNILLHFGVSRKQDAIYILCYIHCTLYRQHMYFYKCRLVMLNTSFHSFFTAFHHCSA